MRRKWWMLAGVMLSGCPDPIQITSAGEDTWKYFPLDGDRTWTFRSTDTSLSYELVAHKTMESFVVNETLGTRGYEITFTANCLGTDPPCDADLDGDLVPDIESEPLFTWTMSSDSSRGAQFHAFNDETYDPAIKLSAADQSEVDVITSETGGVTYTSTIIAEQPCDVPYWRGSPPDGCKVFQLDDGGANSRFGGEYMSIVQFGIVRFKQNGVDAYWQLSAYDDQL